MAEKVTGLVPDGTHEWERYVNSETMVKMIIENYPNFDLIKETGAVVSNPLTLDMAECPSYLGCNYM